MGGQGQPATCLPGRGHAKRLGWTLANSAARPALCGDAVVRWDVGLNPHAAQLFRIELGSHRRYRSWHKATPLQESFVKAEAAEYYGGLMWRAKQH